MLLKVFASPAGADVIKADMCTYATYMCVTACTCLVQVALVLIDEVHLLNESERGSALEAGVVSRIRMVGAFKEMAEVRIMMRYFLMMLYVWCCE